MSQQPKRAALERWGDPIYRLALLATGRAADAERAAEAVLRRVLADPSLELEPALYTALARSVRRRRLRFGRYVLDRAVARIAPHDRLLLGLWLIGQQNGQRLAAILELTPAELVARLDRMLGPDDSTVEQAPHLTRADWLRRSLFGDDAAAAHLRLCAVCRANVAVWQAAIQQLGARLRALLGDARLPRSVVAALSSAADAAPTARPSWVYAVPVGLVAILLLAIVVPWPHKQAGGSSAELTAPALVEAALAQWDAAPATGTQHLRVRAVPFWDESVPFVLDVWQSSGGQHRWEAHHSDILAEWQLANGRDTLRYAADPALASCRWKAGEQPGMLRLRKGGLVFDVAAEQQRAALAARLHEGAYGTGYTLLQRALAATDLRSLGRRQSTAGGVTVLRFTDTQADPAREIVLEIDAQHRLRAAQSLAGDRDVPRDMWRVLQDSTADPVPLNVPAGYISRTHEQLLDPACPSLRPDTVLSLRELAFMYGPVPLPAALPDGATAAIVSLYGVEGSAPSLGRAGNLVLVVTRPGGRLVLEIPANGYGTQPPDTPDGSESIAAGSRRLVLRRETPGAWTGWIEPDESTQEWLPWNRLWSSGWSRAELAAFAAALRPFELLELPAYEAQLWDPHPLPEAVRDTLYSAIAAERPANSTVRSEIQIETRSERDPLAPFLSSSSLTDPYASAGMSTTPPHMTLRRLQRVEEGKTRGVRVESWLPDETLGVMYATDGAQAVWYDAPSRQAGRRPTEAANERWIERSPQLDLLVLLLGIGEHSVTPSDEHIVVERSWPSDGSGLAGLFNWTLPYPSFTGLQTGGQLVARLTLRGDTQRVEQFELQYRSANGDQELLSRAVVVDEGAAAADTDLLALPPLDDDILMLETDSDHVTYVTVNPAWARQTYAWPEAVASVVQDAAPAEPARRMDSTKLFSTSWDRIEPGGLWRSTEYRLPGGESVTLTQGPQAVLGAVLRSGANNRWSRSEAVPVTIEGREYEAWLLESGNEAVLVVEVDELLLHFSVPVPVGTQTAATSADLLRGPVRAALAQLVRP